jgi:hypothetical protein
VSCAECKVDEQYGRLVKEPTKSGVVCSRYTRKRNVGKVDFVQTQSTVCCRRMFWMSLLSYLTILDLDSAPNPDNSKLVSLEYSIASAQMCLPVMSTLTRSSGWSLISSGCSLSRPAEAYFFWLKLTSSGCRLSRPAEAYIPWQEIPHMLQPDEICWNLYCGWCLWKQPW